MISWWFGEYMQTTEHYKRWHPRDHVWMSWEDKRPGTHIGAKHLAHEFIGGRLHKLRITFVPPEEFFGSALTRMPDALAVCARPGLLHRPIETFEAGKHRRHGEGYADEHVPERTVRHHLSRMGLTRVRESLVAGLRDIKRGSGD